MRDLPGPDERKAFGAVVLRTDYSDEAAWRALCEVLHEVPGCFLFLGATASDDPAGAPSNHSPHAVFDDSVLADAAFILAELARRALDRADPV